MLSFWNLQKSAAAISLQPHSPMSEHTTADHGKTPDSQISLRLAVEQLKNAVNQCLGEEHECKSWIAQIEGTISDIEQKTGANGKPKKVRQGGARSSSRGGAPQAVPPAHQTILQTTSVATP